MKGFFLAGILFLLILYCGEQAIAASATGGTITYSGGYVIHTFRSSGTFTPSGPMTVEVLVVAGGGGGGPDAGGGGGAGGIIYNPSVAVTAQPYAVVVGAGGISGPAYVTIPTNGGNSAFGSIITATGGGYGAWWQNHAAANGGSGGGAGGGPLNNYGTGIAGQGYRGGSSLGLSTWGQGGGGGAGAVGGNGRLIGASTDGTGGNGGIGRNYSINGSNIYYGGGGGGGSQCGNPTQSSGGLGGGGKGESSTLDATAGAPNSGGGGGGGCGGNPGTGANGGSGIVIVRYVSGCSYSGSGSWMIDSSENCVISSNVNLLNNLINFLGSGTTFVTGIISNWRGVRAESGARVTFSGGGGLRV